jgi:hypothetical protein
LQDGLVVVADDPQTRVAAGGILVAVELLSLAGGIERVAEAHASAGVRFRQAHGGVVIKRHRMNRHGRSDLDFGLGNLPGLTERKYVYVRDFFPPISNHLDSKVLLILFFKPVWRE